MAIEYGSVDAINNLAILYQNINDFDQAEKCFLMAIDKGDVDAMYNFAIYYEDVKDGDNDILIQKYYLMACQNDDMDAFYNLNNYYAVNLENNKNIFSIYFFEYIDMICYNFKYNKKIHDYEYRQCHPVIEIIKDLYNHKINMMKLHFEYSPSGINNKGFDKAKINFINMVHNYG